MLANRDIVVIKGVPVTTPLRTACDLGRLLYRDSAFAALDAMLGRGRFDADELIDEVERFRGFRGVRQLRAFAPWADPGAESFGESVLRLRWLEAALPARPQTQVVVQRPGSHDWAKLDIACEKYKFAAEYDGEAFHGPEQSDHDESRRLWLSDEAGWTVSVYRRRDVFGRRETATTQLRDDLDVAKVRAARASAY
jgi:very-short-patch-repair endonuclease